MFIVAGTHSGVGKTTITLGMMEATTRRGLVIAPFKAGPDYIDPGLHAAVCKRASYNLDTWMMGADGARRTFERVSAGADIAVVEGVMGLFDGRGGAGGGEGSTAHLAKTLGLPVVLVVDASRMAGSVSALIKGFVEYDPALRFAGVVVNGVASPRHAEIIREAVSTLKGVRLLGLVPRSDGLALPSRHLGLVTRADLPERALRAFIKRAGDMVDEHVDLSPLLTRRRRSKAPRARKARTGGARPVRIAVAMDRAFSFYYEENLDILRSFGAELVPFSPVSGRGLPRGTAGLYLGGGYPELHAERLSANRAMLESIRAFSRSGRPVFAECGGLIYLGRRLRLADGSLHDMAGIFPWTARLLKRRKALGYRELTAGPDMPFLREGETVRGHEFHYSEIMGAYKGIGRAFDTDGFMREMTLASYTHIHFASNPAFARGFVDACRKKG